jgi:hypothetical protein
VIGLRVLAALALGAAIAAPALPRTAGGGDALSATIDVERALLKEDQERHDRLAARRGALAANLVTLYAGLDTAIRSGTAATLDEALARVEAAERERAGILAEERVLVERIRERGRRVALLEQQAASLETRREVAAGPLSGPWEVVLMPQRLRGRFSLEQTGTLVTGTYVLDGGWSGSLQGTLVNRKVYLQRIDSKLGHSADYEGYLSVEGDRIRGTWSSYDVTAQGGSTGEWSAVRKTPSGSP